MVPEDSTQEVQRSADDFRQLAEGFGDVFWLADAKCARLLYISRGCQPIWGYTADELRARPGLFEAALHKEDRASCSLLFAEREPSADPRAVECRIRHRDGDLHWVRIRRRLLRNEIGQQNRIAGIAEDVTTRHSAQEQLRENRGALCDVTMELVLAEEHERRSLAMELHDGLTQTLYAAQLELNRWRRENTQDASSAQHLSDVRRHIR